MKNAAFLMLFSFLFAFSAQAQGSSLKQDSIVLNLLERYIEKLNLKDEQQNLFKEKLEDFYFEKQQLRTELRGSDRLKTLYELGQQENGEMHKILTEDQFDLYIRIKPSLQPLEEIILNKR